MDVYIFSSTNLPNIHIGIERGLWAVAPIDERQAARRATMARQMPIGAAGLFYCSEPQVFTVPFIIQSRPEDRAIEGVWSEPWYWPFSIRAIGSLQHRVTLPHAKATWPILRDVPNVTLALNIAGAMAFTPTFFPRQNWDIILQQLHIDPEQFEDVF